MLTLQRISIGLILFIAAISAYLVATLPLSPDEAHYALYGTFLDLSYFDHPPMVGWVQAFMLMFSEHEAWLRVPAILVNLITGWLLFQIVKNRHSEAAAWIALLLFVVTPMFRLLAVAWVPDVPLMLIGLLCLMVTQKLESENTLTLWLLLGLLLGLAALSKYTAITLAFSVALVLLVSRGWQVLTQPGIWLAAMVALIVLSPILIWNYKHEWISFAYQINHGAGKSELSFVKALQMQAGQILTYGVLLYLGAAFATVWAWKRPEFRSYLLFAWPILILFSLSAAKGRSLPHWTVLGFLFLLPVISTWLVSVWPSSKTKRVLIRVAAIPSVLVLVVIMSVLADVDFGFKDFQHPLQDLTGWKEVAGQTRELALNDDLEYQQIFVPNWSHGSRYAWYARPLPAKILDTREDQFDLWYGSAQKGDNGYLVLHQEKGRYHESLLNRFRDCELKGEFSAERHATVVNHFKIYRCSHYGFHQ